MSYLIKSLWGLGLFKIKINLIFNFNSSILEQNLIKFIKNKND